MPRDFSSTISAGSERRRLIRAGEPVALPTGMSTSCYSAATAGRIVSKDAD
jgi:hypothetical protein